METALNTFEVFARGAAEALLNGLWQGFVLLTLVWLLLRLNRRLNAATRYLVWCSTLALVICLPFAAAGLAGSDGAATHGTRPHGTTQDGHAAMAGAGDLSGGAPDAAAATAAETTSRRVQLVAVPLPESLLGGWGWAALVCAWALVSALMSARVLRSYISLRRIKRRATPLGGRHQIQLDRLRAVHGVRRRVSLRSSREVAVPLLAGLREAAILIPEGLLERLSASEFEQVVLHELAHARRRDDWTKFAQRLAEALFFFHPAVWWLGPRMDMEREVACDDWVISLTGERRQYALCLARLAELLSAPHAPAVAPGAVRARRQVSRRIELLLDKMRNTKPRPSPLGSAAMLLLLTAAAFQCASSLPVIGLKTSASTRREPPPSAGHTKTRTAAPAGEPTATDTDATTHAHGNTETGDARAASPAEDGGRRTAALLVGEGHTGGTSAGGRADGYEVAESAVVPEAVAHAAGEQTKRHGGNPDARAEDGQAEGMAVQHSMRPAVNEMERQHSAHVATRISAIDRKAHALFGPEMREIMRLGEAASGPQRLALQRKMEEKLGGEMRELEGSVSADNVPRAGEHDARPRRGGETN